MGGRAIKRSSEVRDDDRVEQGQHKADRKAALEAVYGSCRFQRLSGGEGAGMGIAIPFFRGTKCRLAFVKCARNWLRRSRIDSELCVGFGDLSYSGILTGSRCRPQKQKLC